MILPAHVPFPGFDREIRQVTGAGPAHLITPLSGTGTRIERIWVYGSAGMGRPS